jgi:signal transduction histidine kinase
VKRQALVDRALVSRSVLLFSALFVAESLLLGWYFLHDYKAQGVAEVLDRARSTAARLALGLSIELAPEGILDHSRVIERQAALAALVDRETASFPAISIVAIQARDGTWASTYHRDDRGHLGTLDNPENSGERSRTGDPDQLNLGATSRRLTQLLGDVRRPRAVQAPIADGAALLTLGISPAALERSIVEVGWQQLAKWGVAAIVSLLLAGIGFSYSYSLILRARRLTEDAQRGKQLAQLGTLASGLAHEIRNPLNALNINLELLEEDIAHGRLNSDAVEMLRASRGEVQRLEQLVKDFLAFARPRAAVREEIMPGELVADVMRFIRPEFTQAGVGLELKHLDIAPTVSVDTNQLKQALLNILSNARDASREGGVVTVTVGPSPIGEAMISVGDEGEGIAAEDLPHIFEVFWSKKLKAPGSGLGLPIAQRVVFEHGGRIDVRSELGKGSQFTIVLPPAAMSPRIPNASAVQR